MGSPPLVIGEPQRAAEEEVAERERHDGRAHRGRLKIFFGAAPGVGKTYTMLEAARHARAGGLDVVVGRLAREATEHDVTDAARARRKLGGDRDPFGRVVERHRASRQ